MKRDKTYFLEIAETLMEKYSDRHFTDSDRKGLEVFEQFIEPCHQFMFTIEKSPSDRDLKPTEEDLDLPYSVVSIEAINGHLTIPREDDTTKMFIDCIVIRETTPREYEFLVRYSLEFTDKTLHPATALVTKGNAFGEVYYHYAGIVKEYLARISRDKLGTTSREVHSMRLGSGSNKKIYKSKPIVVVASRKTEVEMINFIGRNRLIDWSHRWYVSGHWRKIDGIGKNREGEYKEPGWTWVIPHEKGPDNKPLIKKTYVVRE